MKHKVLVINYTADISGSSVALFRLLKALPPEVSFLLITPRRSYMARRAEEQNWNFREVAAPQMVRRLSPLYWLKYGVQSLVFGWKLRREILRFRPGRLLVNCSPNIGWIIAWPFISREARPKVLWMVHELYLEPEWVFSRLRGLIRGYSHRILCVSHEVRRLFPSTNTRLLPNITLAESEPECRNPFKSGSLNFLWVGTVSPRKGLHILPELLISLKDVSIGVKL
ncbi:hypothetical protein ACFL5V_12420, partial [Fibrobacterota bacterium]